MSEKENPDYGESGHQKHENEMEVFNSYLWKNRELLGEPNDSKVYNFQYENLKDVKGLPDKIAVHVQSNPGGKLIVIQTPSKKLYYIPADTY